METIILLFAPPSGLILEPRPHLISKQFQCFETLVTFQQPLTEQEEHFVKLNVSARLFNHARDCISISDAQRWMALAKG